MYFHYIVAPIISDFMDFWAYIVWRNGSLVTVKPLLVGYSIILCIRPLLQISIFGFYMLM